MLTRLPGNALVPSPLFVPADAAGREEEVVRGGRGRHRGCLSRVPAKPLSLRRRTASETEERTQHPATWEETEDYAASMG
ncbi:hypothetical protein E2C01_062117 [Portunus trituberculatus]|uniref:Uncharacterized protein n=1 Tax=Portunus trituberculatus TaxID=210409 RepID=A0A5B7H731_PORTR|nr:hypothetical protein [Portunus trituberculatus]